MEDQTKELLKKEKTKFNIGQILRALFGLVIIIFILRGVGLHIPTSGETLGYNIFPLATILFGGWLIYSAFKRWKK